MIGSEAAEESIDDSACVKQVFQRAEGCGRCRRAVPMRLCGARLGRSNRQGSTIYCRRARSEREAIDLSDAPPRKRERSAFERMASADNSDPLGEVLMMGSVS